MQVACRAATGIRSSPLCLRCNFRSPRQMQIWRNTRHSDARADGPRIRRGAGRLCSAPDALLFGTARMECSVSTRAAFSTISARAHGQGRGKGRPPGQLSPGRRVSPLGASARCLHSNQRAFQCRQEEAEDILITKQARFRAAWLQWRGGDGRGGLQGSSIRSCDQLSIIARFPAVHFGGGCTPLKGSEPWHVPAATF